MDIIEQFLSQSRFEAPPGFRCGTVALIGRPNAGKSTLLNRIIGTKVAIVTPKPQTTRQRILGIHTDERQQIVFIDTPGIHKSSSRLNRNMVRTAHAAAAEADLIVVLQDASKPLDRGTEALIRQMAENYPDKPRIQVLNKVDKIDKALLLPRLQQTQQLDPAASAWIPLSAAKGTQVEQLLNELRRHLPESPPLYDPEWFTDQSQRQLAAEYLREQIFLAMQQEIPFQTAVEIERFEEQEAEEGLRPSLEIEAAILVGSERHKPILIGRGGEQLKQIGIRTRKALEQLFECHIHLKLWVKVVPGWYESEARLGELGLGGND